jgi:hypothetical protein
MESQPILVGTISGSIVIGFTIFYKILKLLCKKHIHSECMADINTDNNNIAIVVNDKHRKGNEDTSNTIRITTPRQENLIDEIQKDSSTDSV